MRLLTRLTIPTLFAGALCAWMPASANAQPLCEDVHNSGTLLLPFDVGQCLPYSGAVLCVYEDVGADPQLHVWVQVCVPAP